MLGKGTTLPCLPMVRREAGSLTPWLDTEQTKVLDFVDVCLSTGLLNVQNLIVCIVKSSYVV